jgi:hypothetical protein
MDGHSEQITYWMKKKSRCIDSSIQPDKRNIYFLTGHGEYELETTTQENKYSRVKAALEAKN